MLKQMGGCFALIGKKKEQNPLYKEQKMYLEEIDSVESMIINQNCVRYYNSQEKDLTIKMNTYGCFVEKCNTMIDFLLLRKHDFLQERSLKESMFGKKFENHDCPELTRCFLNAITLGQTFNDNFIFVQSVRKPRAIMPPCEMVKLRLIMISFIHKEIMETSEFRRNVDEEFVQSFIGTHIFFHDHLIKRWL